mgnify:CR=1 FL=1
MPIKVSQSVNSIFTPLWEKKARYYILIGGRGAGRSTAGSQFLLSRLLDKMFFRAAIMREIHSDIRSTVWQEFMDRVDEQDLREVLDIGESMMTAEYGVNSIRAHGFRQSSNAHSAKLKSLANYNTVLIEEAKEVGERGFMVLDDTLRTVKGDIKLILLTNPPDKNHWMIKRWFDCLDSGVPGFYKLKLKDGMDDTVFIGGTFLDNQMNLDNHTLRHYAEHKLHSPAYYWQEIAGLVPEVVRGKIYSGWQQIDEIPKEARLMGFGLDFGWFPDPAAVVAVWYLNGGYILDEVAYGTSLTNTYLAAEIKKYGDAPVIADSAEPKSIEEMKSYKVKIEGAEKEKGSVEFGIKLVSEKKISVTKRSLNVWADYEVYAWDEDKDGNPKGFPAHRGSDSMDAARYFFAGKATMQKFGVHFSAPGWKSYGQASGRGVSVNLPGYSIAKPGAPGPVNLPPQIAKNVIWPKGF